MHVHSAEWICWIFFCWEKKQKNKNPHSRTIYLIPFTVHKKTTSFTQPNNYKSIQNPPPYFCGRWQFHFHKEAGNRKKTHLVWKLLSHLLHIILDGFSRAPQAQPPPLPLPLPPPLRHNPPAWRQRVRREGMGGRGHTCDGNVGIMAQIGTKIRLPVIGRTAIHKGNGPT